MRVLLLGAIGNFGSRDLLELLAHQHTVTVLVRNERKFREEFPLQHSHQHHNRKRRRHGLCSHRLSNKDDRGVIAKM